MSGTGAVGQAAGVQFHARSLLVWPDRLDEYARAWIAEMVWTGARVLSLDAPLPEDVSGGLSPSVLDRWAADPSTTRKPPGVRTETPMFEEWITMASLWQRCGITPLASSARTDRLWIHARWPCCGVQNSTAATACRQRLLHPVGSASATGLICCLAVAPALRTRGHGAACLAAATACAGGPVIALVECHSQSGGFFAHLGWRHDGHGYLYEHR